MEKIQLEMTVIKEQAARAKEAHEVEMRVKDAKLKLIIKQLQVRQNLVTHNQVYIVVTFSEHQ